MVGNSVRLARVRWLYHNLEPLATDHPLVVFFTNDRLQRYQDLHNRYPLWCGDGYQAGTTPELADKLSRRSRLSHTLDEARKESALWNRCGWMPGDGEPFLDGNEPAVDRLLIPQFLSYLSRGRFGLRVLNFPDAYEALHAAITYAMTHWRRTTVNGNVRAADAHPQPDGPWEDQWPDAIRDILAASPWPERPQDIEQRPSVSGYELWDLRKQAVHDRRARKELERKWRQIGEEVGILPTGRIDKAHTIPPDALEALRDQAEYLLKEVRAYSTNDVERAVVRDILVSGPFIAASDLWTVAQERRRRGDEHYARSWCDAVGLDRWCLRLAYPMLTRGELDKALSCSDNEFLWLFEERLGIPGARVSEQIARHKHK